jgi:hypothetical protein
LWSAHTNLEGVILSELQPTVNEGVDVRRDGRSVVSHHTSVPKIVVPKVVRNDHYDVRLRRRNSESDR